MPINVIVTKTPTKAGKAGKRRRPGPATAAWGALTAMCTTIFLLFESTFALIGMVFSLLLMLTTFVAERYGDELPDPPAKAAARKRANPQGKGSARRSPQRKRASGPRRTPTPRCSARCERSHPKSPCECRGCGGKATIGPDGKPRGHGSRYGRAV